MKSKKSIEKVFPVCKRLFVSNRFLHKQNVALFEKLDRMERSLSQQNLVLERIILEQNALKEARINQEATGDQQDGSTQTSTPHTAAPQTADATATTTPQPSRTHNEAQ